MMTMATKQSVSISTPTYKNEQVCSKICNHVLIGSYHTIPSQFLLSHFIRKYKLDELPQLINVFVGDMSLVGPRPEVRHYVDYWTPEQMHVLDVRPGITDPASIKFRNENELMEKAEDPEKYYIEVIMQEKIKLYLDYVEKHSFWYDLGLIFKTFKVIVTER